MRNKGSQAYGHVGGDAEDTLLGGQISGVDDVALADAVFILLPESQQGFDGVIGAGFDFNGIHLVLRLAVVGDDEVYLDVVAFLFCVILGVEEQSMTIGSQHLGDDIFIEHSLVQPQLSGENLLIDLVFQ